MSEFKFACPVCGQHITANSDAAGSQLECPTCFRKIVVPQAPASSDPKFILSAAEANKPRPRSPQPSRSAAEATVLGAGSGGPIIWVVIASALLAAGFALFLLRDRIFGRSPTADQAALNAAQAANTSPAPTNTLKWTLDVERMEIPDGIVSGRIRGRDFVCERAIVQGGNFTLRHGRSGSTDLGLTINFFSNQPEALAGRTIIITTNNTGPPRVVVRWKENDQPLTANITDGYALKLQFGPITASGLQGKIYLCLSDPDKTCVAGSFNAEIRRSAQRPPRRRD